MMRTVRIILLFVLACVATLSAQTPTLKPSQLLDRLTGKWVLKGTIDGKPVTHEVEANWILRNEYLEVHEISREKDAAGRSAYEAIVLIEWNERSNQYTCLWLDSTSGGALSSNVPCKAAPAEDSIPFLFTLSTEESIHTTFAFRKTSGTWHWTIDDVSKGKTVRFADVDLSRPE